MVTLKGSPKGIMITIEEVDFVTAQVELPVKLRDTAAFFNEETLEVFLTSTSLTEAEVYELRPIVCEVLSNTQVIFIETPPKLLPKQHSPLDDLESDEGITKFIRTKVREGETIEYDNNLIIIGDVERGACVKCGGNLFVLGALYGKAIVTNPQSVVVAMKLMPEHLEIAEVSTSVKQSTLKKFLSAPEIAYSTGTEIKIEQYT